MFNTNSDSTTNNTSNNNNINNNNNNDNNNDNTSSNNCNNIKLVIVRKNKQIKQNDTLVLGRGLPIGLHCNMFSHIMFMLLCIVYHIRYIMQ